LFSIVAIVVDVTSVATASVVHAANVVATMVIDAFPSHGVRPT